MYPFIRISGVIWLLALLAGCSVSPSDYAAYFKNEENGLRKIIETKGNRITIQYISPQLKALNELGTKDSKALEVRSDELKKFTLFELEFDGSKEELNDYLKSSLEYDIRLKSGDKILQPVFYHLEKNPLTTSQKIQVYFLHQNTTDDYQLAIAPSQWLDEVQLSILQEDIHKSPHINL